MNYIRRRRLCASTLAFCYPSTQTSSNSTFAFSISRSSSSIPTTMAMSGGTTTSRPTLRGVIFDMDGTLTIPNLDFGEMYRRCGVERNQDILEAVSKMNEHDANKANTIIEEMEEEGRRTLRLMPGALELGRWLHSHNIPMSIVTRNNKKTVLTLIDKLWKEEEASGTFSPTISRDDPINVPPKPNPKAIQMISNEWSVEIPTKDLLMVGDNPTNDIGFGKAAGISTALVDTDGRYVVKEEEENGTKKGDGNSSDNSKNNNNADIHVEHLWQLPQSLWEQFYIESPLGTNKPLLKYDEPKPTSRLSQAAVNGDIDMLLNSSNDDELNGKDETGNTPLIWASDAGQTNVVNAILNNRRSKKDNERIDVVNIRGYLGATALCRASRRGHDDIVTLLLANGANADTTKQYGT